MANRSKRYTRPAGLALALLLVLPLAAAAGKVSHLHMGHVLESWKDTPGKVGLLPISEEEAKIAAQHAGFAAKKPGDLGWMQTHTRHVRHAIDPSTENGGPGKGYGVLKAAKGVIAHIGFAANADDASKNVKLHETHVSTSMKNVVNWAGHVLELSERVLAASSASEAAGPVREMRKLTTQIVEGAGNKTWKEGEGGVAQARQHMGFMAKGEGM